MHATCGFFFGRKCKKWVLRRVTHSGKTWHQIYVLPFVLHFFSLSSKAAQKENPDCVAIRCSKSWVNFYTCICCVPRDVGANWMLSCRKKNLLGEKRFKRFELFFVVYHSVFIQILRKIYLQIEYVHEIECKSKWIKILSFSLFCLLAVGSFAPRSLRCISKSKFIIIAIGKS